jgi:hypothetical protein
MSRHKLVSHKDTKEFGKMIGKLTLKQIITINIFIITVGTILSIIMLNIIPIVLSAAVSMYLLMRH